MGKRDLRTVSAKSQQARSSDLWISSVIKGLIGRSLDVFWRKRGMTVKKYLSNRGMISFKQGVTTTTVILGQQRVTRVSIDPRGKPEGDGRRTPEGDGRRTPEGDGRERLRRGILNIS